MSDAVTPLAAEFRVRFARAYHVGAGHGRGTSLDAALFTEDAAGAEVPAIRYAHGVLRQAVFDLLQTPPLQGWRRCPASGLPRAEEETRAKYCTRDEVPCPVCSIFGSPAWPSPWSFSSMRPASDEPAPEGRLAQVVSRASVDPRTRRARERTLFSEELGAPLVFAFTAVCAERQERALDELALLVTAARTISALGADRRRGRGECAVCLHGPGPGEDVLLERFARAWLERDPATAAAPGRVKGSFASPAGVPAAWTRRADSSSGRVAVRLALRLEEPLAAGTRPLTGNVLESERFVPGTLLLGALAARALRSGRASEADFLRAFRGGGVLFPDLLPAVEADGTYRPSLPAPPDLFTCGLHPGPAGHQGHGFWSGLLDGHGALPAADDPVEAVRCARCRNELREMEPGARSAEAERRQVKAARLRGFLVAGGGAVYRLEPPVRQETKIQVDPVTGRVQEASLYHRELLAAGTLLTGTLLADVDALADLADWGVLEGEEGAAELRLGKRSGRGYGRATLAWTRVPAGERERARAETRRRVEALCRVGRSIPLVLASRLLVRDALGRTHRSLSPGVFGLEGEGRCAVEWGVVGGFWRHLGLPRRQEAALLPGSVLHWEAPAGADPAAVAERLAGLEAGEPLGERAAEGFGRVAVAPFPYAWAADEAAPEEALPLPDALRASGPPPLGGRTLRGDPAAGLRRGWEARLAAVAPAFAGDEWRVVARLLYLRAGDDRVTLAAALEDGDGEPARELKRVGEGRTAKSFLRDGAGREGWKELAPLLEEACGARVPAEARAGRTRVLADALAAVLTPGK
jgi:hypothetical protein